ncbi:MAG TPA: Zn-dependent hydrolase [Vicinamibacterales bacterium]|jgi:N-carbamoyl-L-amino-acid hydrolase
MHLSRRTFLLSAANAAAFSLAGAPAWSRAAPPVIRVNAARLREHIERLSEFGRPPGGGFAEGVTRVGYSDADLAGRGYVLQLMKAAGLETRIDAAANIIGRRPGAGAASKPIVFGSHVDSVPSGGNFDGPLGTLAAIEVAQTLFERGLTTGHPLEVVAWTNEEGVAYGNGLCGSRAAAGELVPGELDQVWNGVRKADAVRTLGGDPDRIADARRAPGSIHAYLELHIEQGGVLDRAGVPIGVVEGIVAIDRYECSVRGAVNHAGTTPMPDRHDALLAASRLVQAVNEIVTREPGRQVGTVGRLDVTPNAPNVVPGLVRMTVELRDLSAEKLVRLAGGVRARADEIAAATGTTIELTRSSHHEAALADPGVRAAIAQSADDLGFAHVSLPSGAGHDAQMLARLGPMGMVFVPSIGGISHSPRERTSWDDCSRGADVLLRSVLAVDRL